MSLNCCKSEDIGSDKNIQSKVSHATKNANNGNEANTILVPADGVDNNPAHDQPTYHQQEMENGEDDNEKENESKGKDQAVNTPQHVS